MMLIPHVRERTREKERLPGWAPSSRSRIPSRPWVLFFVFLRALFSRSLFRFSFLLCRAVVCGCLGVVGGARVGALDVHEARERQGEQDRRQPHTPQQGYSVHELEPTRTQYYTEHGAGSAKRGSAKRGSAKRGSAKRGSAIRGPAKRGSAKRGSAKRGPIDGFENDRSLSGVN